MIDQFKSFMPQQKFTVLVELTTKLYDPKLYDGDDAKTALTAGDCAAWVSSALGEVTSTELAPNIDSVHERVTAANGTHLIDLVDQLKTYLSEFEQNTFGDANWPGVRELIDQADAVLKSVA